MDYLYMAVPFISWFIAGLCKFFFNSYIHRKLAFNLIGYGGMPSNHSAIVSSIAAYIGFVDGINNPVFGLAVANAFIIMLDANSLRRQVGRHAAAINILLADDPKFIKLRERMGHSVSEIFIGMLVGISVAFLVFKISSQ